MAMQELVDRKVAVIVVSTTFQLEAARAANAINSNRFLHWKRPGRERLCCEFEHTRRQSDRHLQSRLTGKRIEVLRELIPSLAKFAFLTNLGEVRTSQLETSAAQAVAGSIGLKPSSQRCSDEGPLTLERSKTVDEEISAKVIDFLDRNEHIQLEFDRSKATDLRRSTAPKAGCHCDKVSLACLWEPP